MLGLTEEEVKISRSKYGSNEILNKNNNSFFKLLVESFGDPIIKILLIALAIKIVFLFKDFDWYETIGILIAIFLASFISSLSEYGSNKAFERLQEESKFLKCKVYRNKELKEIYVKDIVVGDVVKITSGDRIPADGIIISGSFSVDESFITGESKEVYKKTYGEAKSKKVYGDSVVYKGNGIIKITSVGDKTFMGRISVNIQDKNEESPLRKRLHVLAKQISKLGYIGAFLASISYLFIVIFVNNDFNMHLIWQTITNFSVMFKHFLYVLTLSVTIIIMAVPEGLPMMITLVLSSNMKKMLKDNVLVRKLVGIETSGSLNVLFCDKTGTLTEGKLAVSKIITGDNLVLNSYLECKNYKDYLNILGESLVLNNEAIIQDGSVIGGNITDKAIINFMKEYESVNKVIEKKDFTSETKYSFVKTNNNYYFYKGASEVLLDKCTNYLTKDGKIKKVDISVIKNMVLKYTSEGFRVIVNAYKNTSGFDNLTFISLVVINDVIRKNAKESIDLIKNAGIKVVMITGDARQTALTIGKKLNICTNDSLILTHDALEKMSDQEIEDNISKISVIARALPQDKSRLVSIYKKRGLVVGMTGDGVNDALALKKRDVGFAMGSGSEVAKEASDIVILDNDIKSIVNAILYGRTIFKSIRKFAMYQLTVNICALFLSIIGTLIGITTPITIIQMLWLNMIMDTFAGLAFSYEDADKNYMKEKPKSKNEKIMSSYMINQIVVNGLYSAFLCIIFFKLPLFRNMYRYAFDDRYLLTGFFALFIFLGIINSFLSSTPRLNIFKGILKNKVFLVINAFIISVQIFIIYKGGQIFRTYGLIKEEIFLILILAITLFPVDFIRKKVWVKFGKKLDI